METVLLGETFQILQHLLHLSCYHIFICIETPSFAPAQSLTTGTFSCVQYSTEVHYLCTSYSTPTDDTAAGIGTKVLQCVRLLNGPTGTGGRRVVPYFLRKVRTPVQTSSLSIISQHESFAYEYTRYGGSFEWITRTVLSNANLGIESATVHYSYSSAHIVRSRFNTIALFGRVLIILAQCLRLCISYLLYFVRSIWW